MGIYNDIVISSSEEKLKPLTFELFLSRKDRLVHIEKMYFLSLPVIC